jgi:hypothetical protein
MNTTNTQTPVTVATSMGRAAASRVARPVTDHAINANSTPAELAAAWAPHWPKGTVDNVEISEDLHGWTVRVTVKPNDQRRRKVTCSEHGETRCEALRESVDSAAAWASIHGMG